MLLRGTEMEMDHWVGFRFGAVLTRAAVSMRVHISWNTWAQDSSWGCFEEWNCWVRGYVHLPLSAMLWQIQAVDQTISQEP